MRSACAELFAELGWYCAPVRDAVYVSSPIQLPGGKTLDFYVERVGHELVKISDDGMTLFALRNLGYALEDKRNWRGLRNSISPFGFDLDDSGEIVANFSMSEMHIWGGRTLQALCAIAQWEAECRGNRDEDFTLSAEVERLMRLKRPELSLEFHPRIEVAGLPSIEFGFLWGGVYVDAIAPTPQSVSARLRKALMLRQELEARERILFIVDDRSDLESAGREAGVLAQVAQATTLSNFAQHYSTVH